MYRRKKKKKTLAPRQRGELETSSVKSEKARARGGGKAAQKSGLRQETPR